MLFLNPAVGFTRFSSCMQVYRGLRFRVLWLRVCQFISTGTVGFRISGSVVVVGMWTLSICLNSACDVATLLTRVPV